MAFTPFSLFRQDHALTLRLEPVNPACYERGRCLSHVGSYVPRGRKAEGGKADVDGHVKDFFREDKVKTENKRRRGR